MRSKLKVRLITLIVLSSVGGFLALATAESKDVQISFPSTHIIYGRVYQLDCKNQSPFTATRIRDLGPATGRVNTQPGFCTQLAVNYEQRDDLSFMAQMPADSPISSISFEHLPVESATIKPLSHLSNIESLYFGDTDLDDLAFETFSRLPRLKTLMLERSNLNGSGLKALKGSKLENLALDHNRLTRIDNEALAQLTSLVRIRLAKTKIGDDTIPFITHLPLVKELELGFDDITDRGATNLQRLRNLERLNLGSTKITDKTIGVLSACTKLRDLGLDHSSDVRGEQFQRLSHLDVLSINSTRLSKLGWAQVCKLNKLQSLSCNGTNLTDDDLQNFPALQGLLVLRVQDTQAHEAAFEKLAKKLPRCRIYYKAQNAGGAKPSL